MKVDTLPPFPSLVDAQALGPDCGVAPELVRAMVANHIMDGHDRRGAVTGQGREVRSGRGWVGDPLVAPG